MEIFEIVVLGILAILFLLFFYYVPFLLWISAQVSGVRISLIQLFLMRIRKVPPHKIVDCMIEAHKAGIEDVRRDGIRAKALTVRHAGVHGGACDRLPRRIGHAPRDKFARAVGEEVEAD